MLSRGVLCVVEPRGEHASERHAQQVAGLIATTSSRVFGRGGAPHWRMAPPAKIVPPGCSCGQCRAEVAIHEDWLRPLKGDPAARPAGADPGKRQSEAWENSNSRCGSPASTELSPS